MESGSERSDAGELAPPAADPVRKRPRREALQLRLADFPATQRQMTLLKAFLQEPLSETRRTEPLSNITVQATQRRLLSKSVDIYIFIACCSDDISTCTRPMQLSWDTCTADTLVLNPNPTTGCIRSPAVVQSNNWLCTTIIRVITPEPGCTQPP